MIAITLASANRTTVATGQVESVITYVGAECSDRTLLPPVVVGTNTSDFTFGPNSGGAVIFSNTSKGWFDHFEIRWVPFPPPGGGMHVLIPMAAAFL